MADEKDSTPKAEKPQAAAPAPAATPAEGAKDHCKVTKMTLPQVEAALENAQKHMGGYYSAYAQSLLAKREALQGQPSAGSAKSKRKAT